MNYLIVLILQNINDYLKVSEAWNDVGLSNMSIHTLADLERTEYLALRDDFPLLPSLQHFLAADKKPCHILLATADSQELVERSVASAKQLMEDPEHPGEGALFVVPVIQALSWTKRPSSQKTFGLFALFPFFSILNTIGPAVNILVNQYQ